MTAEPRIPILFQVAVMKHLIGLFAPRTGTGQRGTTRRCGRPVRLVTVLVCVLSGAVPGSAQRVQDVSNEVVRQAIEAYDAGELTRALQLLESAPASLPAPEGAVRALFTGLVHFAQGNPVRANEAFMLAVRLDATAVLDADRHAPSRIAAFEAAREAVLAEWRVEADQAMTEGDTAEALRLWQTVLTAQPGDATAQSRIDTIEEAERQAEAARQAAAAAAAAEDSLLQRFSSQQDTAQTPPLVEPAAPDSAGAVRALQRYNPGQALAMGLVVPGLGQVYAGRRALGLLSLAAAGGAAAAGILFERVSIDCRIQPVGGICPPADVLDERAERPYLVAGVAGAAAVTLIGALDAFFAARRANARAAMAQAGGSGGGIEIGPALNLGLRTMQVEWARIRF